MSALNMSDWEKRGLQAMVSEDDAWKAHYDVTIERQGKKFRGFAKRSNGAVERFDSLRAFANWAAGRENYTIVSSGIKITPALVQAYRDHVAAHGLHEVHGCTAREVIGRFFGGPVYLAADDAQKLIDAAA